MIPARAARSSTLRSPWPRSRSPIVPASSSSSRWAWPSAWAISARPAKTRCFGPRLADALRAGYARLFAEHRVPVDAHDPVQLVLFPEMDATKDAPVITTACWDILGVSPDAMMCATSRMVIKRKGAPHPTVVSCTLLPYDPQFELGRTLREAGGSVPLNHPHCARFCVLGGGSCTANR